MDIFHLVVHSTNAHKIQGSHLAGRHLATWVITCCLPGVREQEGREAGRGLNPDNLMWMQVSSVASGPLCHSASHPWRKPIPTGGHSSFSQESQATRIYFPPLTLPPLDLSCKWNHRIFVTFLVVCVYVCVFMIYVSV